jgi:hypothetical protein
MAAMLLSVRLQMRESNDSSGLHMLDPRNRTQSRPLKVQNQSLGDGPYETRDCNLAHFQTTIPKGNSCGELVLHPELENV